MQDSFHVTWQPNRPETALRGSGGKKITCILGELFLKPQDLVSSLVNNWTHIFIWCQMPWSDTVKKTPGPLIMGIYHASESFSFRFTASWSEQSNFLWTNRNLLQGKKKICQLRTVPYLCALYSLALISSSTINKYWTHSTEQHFFLVFFFSLLCDFVCFVGMNLWVRPVCR